jgi:hypothetical protein
MSQRGNKPLDHISPDPYQQGFRDGVVQGRHDAADDLEDALHVLVSTPVRLKQKLIQLARFGPDRNGR